MYTYYILDTNKTYADSSELLIHFHGMFYQVLFTDFFLCILIIENKCIDVTLGTHFFFLLYAREKGEK